jgi:hypothetical protein
MKLFVQKGKVQVFIKINDHLVRARDGSNLYIPVKLTDTALLIKEVSRSVVFNLFPPRTPRDTFPLNFVPPKLLVHNSSYI